MEKEHGKSVRGRFFDGISDTSVDFYFWKMNVKT